MKYLLDTSIVSDYFNKMSDNHKTIKGHIDTLSNHDELFISILSLYELEYGYHNASVEIQPILKKKINRIKSSIPVLPINEEGSFWFGKIKQFIKDKRNLSKKTVKKHNVDIILASTAITESCVLIVNDAIYDDIVIEFPKFRIEDWTL